MLGIVCAGVAQIREAKSLPHAFEAGQPVVYAATAHLSDEAPTPQHLSCASRGFAVRTTDLESALARRSVLLSPALPLKLSSSRHHLVSL